MYPQIVIPGTALTISSYGIAMSIGFLAAYALTRSRMPRFGIDPSVAPFVLFAVAVGGLVGAKLYFATDMSIRHGGEWLHYFSSRSGQTWYGGLLGGLVAAFLTSRALSFSFADLLSAVAVGLPIGQAIGRVGCFLVGDDYGVASELPWAVAFPHGAPPVFETVHPTQLYECAWLSFLAWVLHRRTGTSRAIFAEYLIGNGLGRILIEEIRLNQPLVLGLTQPQLIAIGMVVFGLGWIASVKCSREVAFEELR